MPIVARKSGLHATIKKIAVFEYTSYDKTTKKGEVTLTYMLIILQSILCATYQSDTGKEKQHTQYTAGSYHLDVIDSRGVIDKIEGTDNQCSYTE
jgi:hypothetical protein